MSKNTISKKKFSILDKELNTQEKTGLISRELKNNILNSYEITNSFDFTKFVLTIASLLIAIGIFSIVVSNWENMSFVIRLLLILSTMGISYVVGTKLENSFPKVSKAFIYLGSLIYGSGVILIFERFTNQELSIAFFIWAIGLIPLFYVHKDKIIFIFIQCLIMLSIFNTYDYSLIFIALNLLAISLLFVLNKDDSTGDSTKLFNIMSSIVLIFKCFTDFDVPELIIALLMFVLGIAIMKFFEKSSMISSLGVVIYGICGIAITYEDIWTTVFDKNKSMTGILPHIFGLLFFLFLLHLSNKGKISSILLICALIFKYYTDFTFDVISQSMFFIVGGLILGSFGFLFEKQRKNIKKESENTNEE